MEFVTSQAGANGQTHRRGRALAWAVPIVILLLGWGASAALGSYPEERVGAALLLGTVIFDGGAILLADPEGQWSMPFLSCIALFLFHIGLFIAPALFGTTPGFLLETDPGWFYRADLGYVGCLLALSFLRFALGATLPVAINPSPPSRVLYANPLALMQRRAISNVGSVLIVSVVFVTYVRNAPTPLFLWAGASAIFIVFAWQMAKACLTRQRQAGVIE